MILTNQDTLRVLLTGSTHYLTTEPGKEAAIYYADAERAHMRLPSGAQFSGRWRLTPNGYHVDWKNGPSASWQIDAEPGRVVYRDTEGVERGALTRIAIGDSERLDG